MAHDPGFPVLFQALTGHPPFPWQVDLFERWLAGHAPEAVDVPTGLGKTLVMAVWLIAGAHGAPVPRRLFYVVDRRAVVDQASVEARELAGRLADPKDTPELSWLGTKLGLEGRGLAVASLRGGLGTSSRREWLADPSAPVLVVGTVDMIGSRLLFEGYGVSARMRPYHAAMVGCDSLIVLDEAHLVPPFRHLLADLPATVGAPFRLLSLSATGRTRADDASAQAGPSTLSLTARDYQDPVAAQRLNAPKSLRIAELAGTLPEALAQEAWTLSGEGRDARAILVFCNARADAEKVQADLAKRLKDPDRVGLFTGARRGFERSKAMEALNTLGFLPDHRTTEAGATFLVATSAAEVGVDLDADDMVADGVPFERLVQRLGRVNRRGSGEAHIVIVPPPADSPKDPDKLTDDDRKKLERSAVTQRALDLLARLPVRPDGHHDASPQALVDLRKRFPADVEAASTPEPLRPAVNRALVDAWSMTSLDEHTGRPEIDPWLRGWVEDDPQTRVVWRTHLPVLRQDGEFFTNGAEAFFSVAPPQPVEELETETWRVREWLLKRIQAFAEVEDTNGSKPDRRRPIAFVLTRRATVTSFWTLSQLLGMARKTKDQSADDGRNTRRFDSDLAGGTLVVDAGLGGLSDVGYLDPRVSDPPATGDEADKCFGVPFTVEVGTALEDKASDHKPKRPPRDAFITQRDAEGQAVEWLLVRKAPGGDGPEDSLSRPRKRENQTLAQHTDWVVERARALAHRLNLTAPETDLLTLAARLHDRGKDNAKWQSAMGAPVKDGPFAKIGRPETPRGTTDGYRHEFGSLIEALEHPDVKALAEPDRDLVLHLIAAHHGYARPLISAEGSDRGPQSSFAPHVAAVALRFARLQRRLGPWRLAWWETLLRAADHQASADFEEGKHPVPATGDQGV